MTHTKREVLRAMASTPLAAAVGTAGGAGRARAQAQAPIRIGVLTDMSSHLADIGGRGGVEAVRMAVEDFGGAVLGRPVEVVSADHQNKPDVGSQLAARWFDVDGVEMVTDLVNSAVALSALEIGRRKARVVMVSGGAASDITNRACSPTGVHWTHDTYSLAAGTGRALVRAGGDTWFFITLDYVFGTTLERETTRFVAEAGGRVLGTVRHPGNTSDFSSYLVRAQSSRAKVIGLANAGTDLVNLIKQAAEFGVARRGQKMAGLLVFVTEVHSLGLQAAQGLLLTEPFYWDQTEETRAFSRRFLQRVGRMPTSVQAGDYGAALHWLKAVRAAGTVDAEPVMAAMRAAPIDDFMTKGGRLREDGRVVRDTYLFEVKAPGESRYPWDYYKQISVVPADEAVRAVAESECPLLRRGG